MPEEENLEQRLLTAHRQADWSTVLALLATNWSDLYQDHPFVLLAVLDELPEQILERESRLRLAQRHIRRNLRQESETQAYGDILRPDADAAPIDYLAALTGRVAASRAAGRHAEAVKITDTAVEYLDALPVEAVPSLANALPEFHYHWGLTYLQASRFGAASHQFTSSHDWAKTIDHRMMMIAAGGALAFIHALHGRARDASAWIAELPALGGNEWWVTFAPTGALLAEALVCIDRLDLDTACSILSRIDIDASPEYWAPYFSLKAFLVTEMNKTGVSKPAPPAPSEVAAQSLLSAFEAYIEALPPNQLKVPLNSEYIGLIRYMLLLHLHQPERAMKALDPEELAPNASVVRQIGVTLYASRLIKLDQRGAARKLIAPLLETPDSRPRTLIPALMIAAGTDTIAQSERLYLRAVALAEWNQSYIGFTLSPQHMRGAIADRLETLGNSSRARR